jgi:hypothetical protein
VRAGQRSEDLLFWTVVVKLDLNKGIVLVKVADQEKEEEQ